MMDCDTKLIAILRRQYHIILTASWEKIYSCVADIIRIAQITLEMVNNALLVNNRGFDFFWLDVSSDLSACVHGMDIFSDFGT